MKRNKNASSVRLLVYAQLGILFAFICIALLTVALITRTTSTVLQLSKNALPKVVEMSSFTSQITQLSNYIYQLSHSASNPARQNAFDKILKLDSRIKEFLENQNDSRSISARQLSVIQLELTELNRIIQEKIDIETSLLSLSNEVNRLSIEHAQSLERLGGDQQALSVLLDISVGISDLMQQQNLYRVREVERQLLRSLERSVQGALINASLSEQDREQVETLASQIRAFSELKAQSLKKIGRARGRTNFVINLLEDARSNVDYQNYLINYHTLAQVESVASDTKFQQQIVIVISIAVCLTTLIIIWILYKKIVSRILSLTEQVYSAERSELDTISISGNDEIADLARVFNTYLQTVKKQESSLLELSLSDALTDIPNRRAFDKHLDNTIAQAIRYQWSIAILLIDIDHFKAFNDSYGHSSGDHALKKVAHAINQTITRRTDICARFGGEEFVCVLCDTTEESVKNKSHRILSAVADLNIEHKESLEIGVVTVSVGANLFDFSKDTTWTKEQLIISTDKSLYMAKKLGRNRCIFDHHH